MTPLDAAYLAMAEDEDRRLGFYERLADGEVFLMLEEEAQGDTLKPRLFPLEDGPIVLIFDLEERMSAFAGGIAPYAALPGRVVARMLAGQGIGLGINLGGAPSELVLPPEAVDWLAEMLDTAPEVVEALPEAFHAPKGLPQALVAGLDAKLARAGGLAAAALLVGVTYQGGRRGHMLAFVDAVPEAEAALARAAGEALAFSGIEAGEMDVAFVAGGDAATTAMARVALRFDLPAPVRAEPAAPMAPGSDPARPPKLR
ncbi:MAG: hypothetical protein CFE34_08475 [Rhodobacteraceae bacterium PARR1]|nr:MAG: hypothetical protein CFE34_08475 [Rhodobacteraceae bacterium PARR1]